MANNQDNRPRNPDEPAKPRPDNMRPQRSAKPGEAIPPVMSAATRRPPRQGEEVQPAQPMTQRQTSHYQKDLQRQRQLILATIAVVAITILVLAVGFFQSLVAPNIKTLAEVNGQSVSSGDYYKFRKIQLFKIIGQLQQQLSFAQGDQQNQIQSRIQLYQTEISDIGNGNRPVDQPTLEAYTGNLVAEKAAKDQFGIEVKDDELNGYLQDLFLGTIYTLTPNPTGVGATSTAGVVNTAVAAIATSTAGNTTPLPTATLSVSPSPSISATAATTPGVTGTAGAAGSPAPTSSAAPAITGTVSASTTVTATTTVTPTVTATSTPLPNDKVQSTISASRGSFVDSFKRATGLSEDDYKKYELKPQLIKKKVSERLVAEVPKIGEPYPQIKVSEILAKDEATAKDLQNQLKGVAPDQLEAKFGQLARDKSEDKVTAAHNGDVGWVVDGILDADVYKAVKDLSVGQLTDPIKTSSGYYLALVTGKDDKRALDAVGYNQLTTTDQNGNYVVFTKWLKDKVDAAKPKYNTPPTPTAVPTQVPAPVFTPVIPPTATATAVPTTAVPTTAAATIGTPGATTAAVTTANSTTAAVTTASGTTPAVTTASGTTAAVTTASSTTAAVTTVAAPSATPTK